MPIFDLCETAGFLRVLLLLKYFFRAICIITPLLLMVPITVQLFKCVVSGNQDDLKALVPMATKKLILALLIFFVPTIANFIFSLVTDTGSYIQVCLDNATPEMVQYYERLEPVKKAVETAKENPTQNNIDKARELINNSMSTARGDTIENFLVALSEAESAKYEQEEHLKCINKNGVWKDGECLDQVTAKMSEGGSSSGSGSGSGAQTHTVDFNNAFNNEYKLVDSTLSVTEYQSYIKQHGIKQNSNESAYGDKCLGFAYVHASSLYDGNKSRTADQAANYQNILGFRLVQDANKKVVLKHIYNEIANGRPCVIQVNGRLNKDGSPATRHFVTVVGMKKSVKNANDLDEDELLILDSWDGEIERTGKQGGAYRFMIAGSQVNREPTGYIVYKIA